MLSISGQEIVSPDYDIIDNSKYLYTNIISTSRGCPLNVIFAIIVLKVYIRLILLDQSRML